MATATTQFLRWCNFGQLNMKKFKLNTWYLIFLLCFHRCYCNGDPIIETKVDTKLTEESSLNFLLNCSISLNEDLKSHINESISLCTVPSEHELVILCDDFLNISKDFCHATSVQALPKINLTDAKSVCNPPVKIPQQLVSKFDKSGVIFTLSQEDKCGVRCENVLSLCVLGRVYLDIYTQLLLKPITVTKPTTTTTTTTTTTKSAIVSSPGTTKKGSSTITPTTTPKILATTAVSSTKKLVQPNLENNYEDSDQLKYTLSLQENDLEQNKEDDPLLDDMDDAEKGEMEAPKPVSNVEESAAAGDKGNVYGRKKGTYGDYYPEDGNSHFFVYFLTVVVLCILGYVLYHNKKKVIALIVEGRQDRRRRPNTNQYRKLDSNLEEAMHSYENGSEANGSRRSNIIY